jgi:4a-hydroxytetrahydrobiopterin dehydratase
MKPLADKDIQAGLQKLTEWSECGDAIQRTYTFADFLTSMRFVNQVAQAAEDRQHHPDILVRWNKVTLTLSTHDAGGITRKDFDCAAASDGLAKG